MKTDTIIPQAQAKVARKLVDELARLTYLSRGDLAFLIGRTERALYNTLKAFFPS